MSKPSDGIDTSRAEKRTFENTGTTAEEGDAEVQFSLGLKFAEGVTARDFVQAAHWYGKAADQDHALAQLNLGVMYERGQGVPRDKEVAMAWFLKAAVLGDAGAQYNLGMRQNRLSMDQGPEAARESRIEAYKWLWLASAQRYKDSSAGCDFVSMGMTHACVVEGKRRAAAFLAHAAG